MKRASQADTRQLSIFDKCTACNGTGDLCEGRKTIKIECIFCDGRGYGQKEFKPARRRAPSQKRIMADGVRYYQQEVEIDELYNPYTDATQARTDY